MVVVAGGVCTITGYHLRQDHMFYLFGNPVLVVGLILLVVGGSGLGRGLGRLAVARGILPRRLLPLFVGVPVVLAVLFGLLVVLYMPVPYGAAQLRLQQAMGKHDFAKAVLDGADLSGVDLSEASLNFAHLSGADLSGADLSDADLWWAHLDGADLSGADLSGADLRDANLSGANLSEADLSGANLSEAQVSSEQLAQAASLEGAIMPDGTVHE